MTNHPARKMLIDLASVPDGWQRVFHCEVCGRHKAGYVGKGLTIRGAFWCDGKSVKSKPQNSTEGETQ